MDNQSKLSNLPLAGQRQESNLTCQAQKLDCHFGKLNPSSASFKGRQNDGKEKSGISTLRSFIEVWQKTACNAILEKMNHYQHP